MNFFAKIAYNFNKVELFEEAMTHPSVNKNSKKNYQRLEFLGDKILSLVIADFLMNQYPSEPEGDLSKRHSFLVSGETLSQIALQIGLEQQIILSWGEKNLGGTTNKRNLENALEALIGAIYLDSNYQMAKNFIMKFWQDFLQQNIAPPKDPVSELQEIIQMQYKQLPQYLISKSGGLDHEPTFIAKLKIPHLECEFEAQGKSKKEAQKEVAKVALKELSQAKN